MRNFCHPVAAATAPPLIARRFGFLPAAFSTDATLTVRLKALRHFTPRSPTAPLLTALPRLSIEGGRKRWPNLPISALLHAALVATVLALTFQRPLSEPPLEQPLEVAMVSGTNSYFTGSGSPPVAPDQPHAENLPQPTSNGAAPLPLPAADSEPMPAPPGLEQQVLPKPPFRKAEPSPVPPTSPTDAASVNLGDGLFGGGGYDQDSETTTPIPDRRNLRPIYPPDAIRRHEQGMVVLRITVAEDGHVASVELVQSSGFVSLDQSALERAPTWHFKPTERNGLPAADTFNMAINFRP